MVVEADNESDGTHFSQVCRTALEGVGCRCIANILVGGDTWDLALIAPTGARVLVRCCDHPSDTLIEELVRVRAQKTFDAVVLVSDQATDVPVNLLSIWSQEQLHDLAPTLALTPMGAR